MRGLSRSLIIFAVSVSLISLVACTRNRIVAKVGDYEIRKKDASYRDRVVRVYYPLEERDMGLTQLIQTYTKAQILRNNGRPITDLELKNEEGRIDRSTLMPDMLRQIKDIFGDDHDAYVRVFVFPTLVERIIYFDFFLNDPRVQSNARITAEVFAKELKNKPEQMLRRAKERGLRSLPFSVSPGGLRWETAELGGRGMLSTGMSQYVPPIVAQKLNSADKPSPDGQHWIDDVVRRLKPGQIFDQVVDFKEYFAVVRYLRPMRQDAYRFDAVIFAKADYDKWLEAERKKVSVLK